ncbi:transferrin-binding protein-like solute binding protein [Altererythrobacter sp. Root672]|uniref:transferrin-binding protein-like solute binding protein n=1 Tax=Altererythrobacter sp. Root672 TaxID=1736584 RepID=UPI0006F658D1|nr:transferrin-binding protein-like solute binding protein [Altererythrobacter sp. Root672]KRA83142.1 hypothetical protein ASD76_03465 [Altererythrobacter sp. Root672]
MAGATLEYDLPSDSYIIRLGTETFEFGPGDATSDAWGFLAFEKEVGESTTKLDFEWRYDTPWLTNTEYVRLAQLVTSEANIPEGTKTFRAIDLVFGVPSDAANVPKAGSATFGLSLLGSRSSNVTDSPLTMSGAGSALVDFASGQLNFTGVTHDYNQDRQGASNWGSELTGNAALTAGKNVFTGTFTSKTGTSEIYEGGITGSFYGPEAEEIGGTFYGTSGPLYYSLAFAGLEQPHIASRDTLASLTGTNRLDSVQRVIPLPDSDPYFAEYPFGEHVIYDAQTKTYEISRVSAGAFGAANRTPAKDQADIVSYGAAVAWVDGKISYDIGRFDGETDGMELTYASFFRVVKTLTDLDDKVLEKEVTYLAFGNATPADQLPRTGTASYEGRLFGDVNDGTNLLSPLRGTAALNVNFGTQALAASLSPRATNLNGGVENFGTFNFAGSLDSFRGYFEALRIGGGDGNLAGRFFGDRAQEFGATFGINLADRGLMLEGVAVGKQVTTP